VNSGSGKKNADVNLKRACPPTRSSAASLGVSMFVSIAKSWPGSDPVGRVSRGS
jgi:hypothetical protein